MKERPQLGNEPWRVFCAVELPDTVREAVLRRIAHLKEAVPDAKASWSRDANLHLTLKFLGEIPQTSVPNVSTAALRAVAGIAPFSVRLEETGAFPREGHPRVLWIGINDFSGELGKLHSRLEDESRNAGFASDNRPFHPHLTLARLRQPRHARTLVAVHRELDFDPAEIAVSELLVIRSELSSEGSRYTVISRHALNSADEV